jgi:hypothetical protein
LGKDLQPALPGDVGNYDLEGWDDPILYPSDWFAWEGDLRWWDQHPAGGGRQGLIGIEGEDQNLLLTWHLDNWPGGPLKHVYVEADVYWTGAGHWQMGMVLPPGVERGGNWKTVALGNDWYRVEWWFELLPNPLWEEFTWNLSTLAIAPGGTVLIDNWHVATECVPEPGTMALFGLGAVGLAGYWRRRRNAK